MIKAWPKRLIIFLINFWNPQNKKSSTCVRITPPVLSLFCQVNAVVSNLLTVTPRDNNLLLKLIYYNWKASLRTKMVVCNFYTLFGLSSDFFRGFTKTSLSMEWFCQKANFLSTNFMVHYIVGMILTIRHKMPLVQVGKFLFIIFSFWYLLATSQVASLFFLSSFTILEEWTHRIDTNFRLL